MRSYREPSNTALRIGAMSVDRPAGALDGTVQATKTSAGPAKEVWSTATRFGGWLTAQPPNAARRDPAPGGYRSERARGKFSS